MTTEIYIDFETRSELGLSAKDRNPASTYEYARHPSTEIMLLGYAIDDGPVKVLQAILNKDTSALTVLRLTGRMTSEYETLVKAYQTPGAIVIAHNAYFERNVWDAIMVPAGWPEIRSEQWRCSMTVAGYSGLPLGLDDACKMLGLESKHDQTVLHRMMKPNPAWYNDLTQPKWLDQDPEDWAKLIEYNRQDVELERALWKRLRKFPEKELRMWQLNFEINQRGVPIDRELAAACADLTQDLQDECANDLKELTCNIITAPTQTQRIKEFANNAGVPIENLQEATVTEWLEELEGNEEQELVYQLLEIRSVCAGAAAGKFKKMLQLMSADDRVRGAYQDYGARTGRFASRGLQVHNLAKQKIDWDLVEGLIPTILDRDAKPLKMFYKLRQVLSSAVRPCICAPPGKLFAVQDYSAVEARGVAWAAGARKLLEMFESDEEIYKTMAALIYRKAYSKVTKSERDFGKTTALGLGFGMQSKKFGTTTRARGCNVSDAIVQRGFDLYHELAPEVSRLWKALDKAFADALTYPGRRFKAGAHFSCVYFKDLDVLAFYLPSGRPIFYHKPRISDRMIKVEGEADKIRYNQFSYLGRLGQKEQGKIGRVWAWGGKMLENGVQAFCRDLLVDSMLRVNEQIDYARIVLHTHDEIACEVDEGYSQTCYEEMGDIMRAKPDWAAGMPIDVAGWVGRRYRKD